MKAIQVKEYVKTPGDLKGNIVIVPDPVPKPDEYLIAIRATAANFFDILQVQGKYQHQPPRPFIAGFEFAGTVLSTPNNSSSSGGGNNKPPKYPLGTAVFGARQGAFATRLAAREGDLLPVPPGWTFAAAAGLFVTAPTSYAALVVRAGLKPHNHNDESKTRTTVLVHAAAGGVGLAAVQVAKAMGATVIATASTEAKLAVARRFGADHTVLYTDNNGKDAKNNKNKPKTPSWPDQVRALTPGGRGVDIVYDPVGLVDWSTKCTAWNGRILVVGFAAGSIEKVAMNKVLLKNISLVGIHWGMYASAEPAVVPEVWAGIGRLVAEGKLRGTEFTDEEFVGLERMPDALTALGSRRTWGKVVVKIPDGDKSKL